VTPAVANADEGARQVVSVIVPAYNEAATIKAVLERVRAQSVDGLRFEIVDGSCDGAGDILRAKSGLYDKLIRLDRNGDNGPCPISRTRPSPARRRTSAPRQP
jgi:glycosyltransferase involved in cell wall biosynthesis